MHNYSIGYIISEKYSLGTKVSFMENGNILSLSVLRGLLSDDLLKSFFELQERADDEFFCSYKGNFLNKLYLSGAENNFFEYICDAILYDENAFTKCCANGKAPSTFLVNAYLHDVKLIFDCALKAAAKFDKYFSIGKPSSMYDFAKGDEAMIAGLKKFYKKYGCGQFAKYTAFAYENGEFSPIKNPSAITLDALKGYIQEKAVIDANIVNFIKGLPYGNMLLYGDRGTGKSSTIHAMLNKYWKSGLRIVELNKENMLELPKIRQKIISNPLKFIIFIDDLSLDESDEKISGLKAALEGSVAGNTSNTMIVATSNRRHIIKENLSDRENSVHVSDSLQEQLSLSDRFGITVLFSSTDKAQYLELVKSIASDEGLATDDTFLALAERWALVKGGRSPRRARQFVDLAVSCKKRNIKIDF